MDKAFYAHLLSYATASLPKNAFLEPADLVNEAFVRVGSENKEALKKEIRSLAYGERGNGVGVINIDHINYKDRSIKETARVCKNCNEEKSINDFRAYRKKGAVIHANVCKRCSKKKGQRNPVIEPRATQEAQIKESIKEP